MLLRREHCGVIAIPQPSHAWLSGQLARAFGNAAFPGPEPYEEVCLAAEQHDIGWHSWELTPALDSTTGLPQEFFKVSPHTHIALWRDGVQRARAFGLWPALLVSLHADTIYKRYFDFAKASPGEAEAVHAFLSEQHELQARLSASLRADPMKSKEASAENIARNQYLIAALDWISLEICRGVHKPVTIPGVPAAGNDRLELVLRPADKEGEFVTDPWPFRETSVKVHAEGKRLGGRFLAQAELLHALEEAEPVRVTALLHPA